MKKSLLTAAPVILGLALLSGCGQKQPEAQPEPSAKPAADALQSVVDAAKPAAEQALKAATNAVNTAVADASAKAGQLIEQARSLVAQNKFTEALNSLQQLGGLKLTPEQEKLVASLKEQIQKALASKPAAETATEAAGSLLKK